MIKYNTDGTKEITLNKEEQDIDNILALNEQFLNNYKLVKLCDDLAETINRHDQARHDQRLIDIRDELGAICHLIQNDDNYQSYSKIHYLDSERKKPIFGYIPPF